MPRKLKLFSSADRLPLHQTPLLPNTCREHKTFRRPPPSLPPKPFVQVKENPRSKRRRPGPFPGGLRPAKVRASRAPRARETTETRPKVCGSSGRFRVRHQPTRPFLDRLGAGARAGWPPHRPSQGARPRPRGPCPPGRRPAQGPTCGRRRSERAAGQRRRRRRRRERAAGAVGAPAGGAGQRALVTPRPRRRDCSPDALPGAAARAPPAARRSPRGPAPRSSPRFRSRRLRP